MSLVNTICLIVGYIVMGSILGLLLYAKLRDLYRWIARKPRIDMSGYYMGPPTPCCCEYHPQNVCCICGEIEGATEDEWRHVQPPKP